MQGASTSNAQKGQNFDLLQSIIDSTPLKQQQAQQPNVVSIAISSILNQKKDKFIEIVKQFSTYLLQNRHIFINADHFLQSFEEIVFLVAKNNKNYTFGKNKDDYRGFVLCGKAVSIYRSNKKQEFDGNKAQKQELINLIQQGNIRLFEQDKLMLLKSEKKYQINDILLQHSMPDANTDEVYLGNQVFSPFVPIQKSIVMIIPYKVPKPQCFNFIKGSLLHCFIDQIHLLNKIMTKQTFYKNSILKGIFFVQQGEVLVKSGRIVARGWTTYGKCKISGFGWKFKPISFVRFLLKNLAVWKQFFNDITLNNEYPFNIIHILGLNDGDDFTSSAEWKSLGRKKIGNSKSPRLPRLNFGVKSVDESKLEEIQKMRHYDDRINDLFIYKEDLFNRKMKGFVHSRFEPIFRDQKSQQTLEKRKKEILYRMNSKRSQFSKREIQVESPPAENILIMSVLKKLESIIDLNQPSTKKRQKSQGNEQKYKNHFYSEILSKRDNPNVKVLPIQFYERKHQIKRSKKQ